MGKNIGIDFGTTTTEVSYTDDNGHSRVLKIDQGQEVIPTVLYFKSEREYEIGIIADKHSRQNPDASIRNFKLFLTDSTKRYRVIADNGDDFYVKPLKAAQLFLNKLIQLIQGKLMSKFKENGTIEKAVITVPAQFNPEEKEAVKEAGVRAGFVEVKIAAEPTAAAVAYQEETYEDGETILVYDFGGGTFDVSVIRKSGEGVYQEIATGGDKSLGGNNITEKLAKVLWENCLKETNTDFPFDEEEAEEYTEEDYGLSEDYYRINRANVWKAAEEMKLEFSEDDEPEVYVEFYYNTDKEPELVAFQMNRDSFDELIEKDIKETVELTGRVLKETLEKEEGLTVDEVVLAGGSSQIPLVREKLRENEILKDLVGVAENTPTLIAKGAAKLASLELQVEERTRFEIGTRQVAKGFNHEFVTIIKAGEMLPCSGKHRFYPTHDNQNELEIPYYQKDVKNYPDAMNIDKDAGIDLVNEFTITIPETSNDWYADITFSIEADGTPKISAEIFDSKGNKVTEDGISITKRGNLD